MKIPRPFSLRRACLLLLAAIACLVLAGGIWLCIAIKLYFQPDLVAASLKDAARNHLGASLAIGSINTGLLSGRRLQDVTLCLAGTTISCPQAQLRCSLPALGLRRLILREIELRDACLTATGSQRAQRVPAGTGHRGRQPLAVLVLPTALHITHSRAILKTLTIDDINIRAPDISVFMPFTLSATAIIANAPLSRITLSARVSIPRRTCSATLAGNSLPAGLLEILTGTAVEWHQGAIDLNVQSNAAWNRPIDCNGTMTLSDARMFMPAAVPALPPLIGTGIDAALEFAATFDPTLSELTILRLTGSLLGSPLKGSGSLRQRGRRLDGDALLQLPGFDLGRLSDRVRFDGPGPLQHLRLDGICDLELRLSNDSGRTALPALVLSFKGNPITIPLLGQLRPRLWGEIGIDPATIRLANLRFGTPELSVTLSGDISDYQRWPPRSTVQIVSSRMHFDTLLQNPQIAAQYEIGPIDLGDMRLEGPINLGDIAFLGIPLGNVQGTYRIADNQVRIDRLQGSIGAGRFVLASRIDLSVKGLDYYTRLRVDAAPLRLLTPLVGPLPPELRESRLSGTCAIKGGGTAPGQFVLVFVLSLCPYYGYNCFNVKFFS